MPNLFRHLFHLSFPNVSIGNPELFERHKKNGFRIKYGMTKETQGITKDNGAPIRSRMTGKKGTGMTGKSTGMTKRPKEMEKKSTEIAEEPHKDNKSGY